VASNGEILVSFFLDVWILDDYRILHARFSNSGQSNAILVHVHANKRLGVLLVSDFSSLMSDVDVEFVAASIPHDFCRANTPVLTSSSA